MVKNKAAAALDVPHYQDYMEPTVRALRSLGGSATVPEITSKVAELMKLSEAQLGIPHDAERGPLTEVVYRMSWARTYLKNAGYLENSQRGVWALTEKGRGPEKVDPKLIVRQVRSQYDSKREIGAPEGESAAGPTGGGEQSDDDAWRADLLSVLSKLPPDAFERLCQRVLRESGFVEVEVTGKTGDGGIDGRGILRLQKLVSFHVFFQCKRWRGSVGSQEVRNFRGAMVGRTDKGLLLTTGGFSPSAQEEATRDGASAIDLIDGEQLVDLLKALSLGVKTEKVERVTVDGGWFASL